jgi:hypothetical protein
MVKILSRNCVDLCPSTVQRLKIEIGESPVINSGAKRGEGRAGKLISVYRFTHRNATRMATF